MIRRRHLRILLLAVFFCSGSALSNAASSTIGVLSAGTAESTAPVLAGLRQGLRDHGTGILNNALYAGRLEWNRCAYVKDPRTGKRVARPNPRAQWEIVPVPELRIVDDGLWKAVKARQVESGLS
jgi:hypothetical protein